MKYKVQNIVNNEYLDDDSIFLLPNGEVGYFIEDGSYPHYRKFGHQEDFKVINEECERLQKQLDIALRGLNFIVAQSYGKDMFDCAKGTLKQIKELDK